MKDTENKAMVLSSTRRLLTMLLRSNGKLEDARIRAAIRMDVVRAHESDLDLGLCDSKTDLGSLMAAANVRSRIEGYL